MERLWERSREGRKETNRKLSTGTGKESMRDQAGENGENRRSESGDGHRESSCDAEPGREGKENTEAE